MTESGKSLSNSKNYCSVFEKISKINDVKQNEKHPFTKIFYNQLILPQLLKTFCLAVTPASGSILCLKGIVQCSLQLGGHFFEFNIIVCQNVTRPIILVLDFMCKHQTGLTWYDIGKGCFTLKTKC